MPRPLVGQRFQINDRVMKKPKNGSSAGRSYGVRYGFIKNVERIANVKGAIHTFYEVQWDGKQSYSTHAQHVLEAVAPESPHFSPSAT
tara:strand:+ start:219 stop:482 length:264 start_codon:yes stop_codon:yes gene_type:complete